MGLYFHLDDDIRSAYEEWIFRIGEKFTPDSLGLEMICKLPKRWILDCRSTSKTVQMQMIYEFNVNGYVFTVRELRSGKNYRIIMKKVNEILNLRNEKEGKDNNLMNMMPQVPQMQEMIMPVKLRTEEKANIKPHNVELSQEKTSIEKKLFFLGFLLGSLNLITIALYTIVAILLRICKNHEKDSNYLVVNYNTIGESEFV